MGFRPLFDSLLARSTRTLSGGHVSASGGKMPPIAQLAGANVF